MPRQKKTEEGKNWITGLRGLAEKTNRGQAGNKVASTVERVGDEGPCSRVSCPQIDLPEFMVGEQKKVKVRLDKAIRTQESNEVPRRRSIHCKEKGL